MAIINTPYNQQSYNPYLSPAQPAPTPSLIKPAYAAEAIGPVPTPYPPSGVSYTPQYPGGQIFGVQNPPSYTSTPEGAAALKESQQSSGTVPSAPSAPSPSSNQQSYSDQALIDEYKRRGWTDETAIRNDIKAGGYTSWGGSGSPSTPPAPTKEQIKQTNIDQVGADKGADVAADYANYADQMSPEQYYAMIDQEAGNTMSFLQQQEDAIRADQPGIEQGITSQADLLRNKAYSTKEDAQSAARRLYSELQQGYKQRFGGASSAGEAAMALTANEQQRQMAQNNRTYQEAVAQVDLSASQAIQSAQSEFRNQLLAITQNRVATENERLAARRQALSDLSQKVFAIQQQRESFKQNIALMQEQARIQNESNMRSMTTNPTSTLTMSNTPAVASGNQGLSTAIGSIGNVSSGISKTRDPLASGVYPIMSMIDGRTKYSDGSIR